MCQKRSLLLVHSCQPHQLRFGKLAEGFFCAKLSQVYVWDAVLSLQMKRMFPYDTEK